MKIFRKADLIGAGHCALKVVIETHLRILSPCLPCKSGKAWTAWTSRSIDLSCNQANVKPRQYQMMNDNYYYCSMSIKKQLPPLCRLRSLRTLLAGLPNQSGQAYDGPVVIRHQRQE